MILARHLQTARVLFQTAFCLSICRNPLRYSSFVGATFCSKKDELIHSNKSEEQPSQAKPLDEKKQKEDNKQQGKQNYVIRCDGCSVRLQSHDKNKYGYISDKILQEAVDSNISSIKKLYNPKVKSRDAKILEFMHQVEKESGITIFDPSQPELQNLNNMEVLMRLEDKISQYEQENQSLNRHSKDRTNILCFRCFSLKHHNRLPEEYDRDFDFSTPASEFILSKVFNRHKDRTVQFFFLVDVFDILGTFPQWLFEKLMKSGQHVPVSIIVNKIDVINKGYLNEEAIHSVMKKRLRQYLKQMNMEEREKDIKIFFISCNSRDGIKKMKEYIGDRADNIQLVGLPNTGKTSLLNILAKLSKSTSKIPGTTVKVSQHSYQVGKKRVIYDMPGLYSQNLLYNLINKPSARSMLTWHKRIAPGLLTHSAIIYGGKIEIEGVRIIVFGNGGACSSDNRWFLANFREFWKGLPEPSELKITKHQVELEFQDGKADDLEIAGYGFIGFRLCTPTKAKKVKLLTLYLPEKVAFGFRSTILTNDSAVFHKKSAVQKKFALERLTQRAGRKAGRAKNE